MFGSRVFQLLLVALSVPYYAQAVLNDKLPDVEKRQDDLLSPLVGESSTFTDPAAALTSFSGSSSGASSASDALPASSSTDAIPTTSSPTIAVPQSTSTVPLPPTSDTAQFTTPPASSVSTSSSSAETEQSTFSKDGESTKSRKHTIVVTTEFTVVTKTNSDGTKSTMTSAEKVTSTLGLNTGDGSDDNSSMSSNTRNTIIGVVVGVGGAVALGALALVAYRVWGRKKNTEESEAFMAYGNTGYEGIGGKSEHDGSISVGHQPSPFQSTLEDYHGPNSGPVNHSHNF